MKHHYIPQFYLKQWAGPDGKFERFAKLNGRGSVKRLPPAAVGYMRNLYRIPDSFTTEPNHLEHAFFSRLDNDAASALRILVDEEISEESHRALFVFCEFIISLLHRSPTNLDGYKRAGRTILTSTLDRLSVEYKGLRADYSSVSHETYVSSITKDGADGRVLSILPDIVSNSRILTALRSLHWAKIKVPLGCPELLLSDDPLVRTDGLHRPDGHIAMPLSPSILLLGFYDKSLAPHLVDQGAAKTIKEVNKWAVESARHFVVATDRRQQRFIFNRFGSNLKQPLMQSSTIRKGFDRWG